MEPPSPPHHTPPHLSPPRLAGSPRRPAGSGSSSGAARPLAPAGPGPQRPPERPLSPTAPPGRTGGGHGAIAPGPARGWREGAMGAAAARCLSRRALLRRRLAAEPEPLRPPPLPPPPRDPGLGGGEAAAPSPLPPAGGGRAAGRRLPAPRSPAGALRCLGGPRRQEPGCCSERAPASRPPGVCQHGGRRGLELVLLTVLLSVPFPMSSFFFFINSMRCVQLTHCLTCNPFCKVKQTNRSIALK